MDDVEKIKKPEDELASNNRIECDNNNNRNKIQ